MNNKGFFVPEYIDIYGGTPFKENASVTISGAKNEVLGSMAACLLTDQPVILRNVPYIQDVLDLGNCLIELGVDVKYNPAQKIMQLHAKNITTNVLSDKTTKFRAAYYLWGSLLSRFSVTGEFNSVVAKFAGGCDFGNRGYDYHFNLLKNVLGVEIQEEPDSLTFKLPASPKQEEVLFSTSKPSHGATFHYLLTSAITNKRDYMYNSALEPEVASLIQMLRQMGAVDIRGQNATAIISGAHNGLLLGCDYTVQPDRMETGFYALLAAATKNKISIRDVDYSSCMPWLNLLKEFTKINPTGTTNMDFDFRNLDWNKVSGKNIIVSPYPGKETDMEQLWLTVLAMANSNSTIIDSIWPGRLGKDGAPEELHKLGINMTYDTNYMSQALKIDIFPSKLRAVPDGIRAANLRGAAGIIIGASAVNGMTRILQPGFATRGHPNLIENLNNLGIKTEMSTEGTILDSLPFFDAS